MLSQEIAQLKREIAAAESAIEAIKNDRPRPLEPIGDSVFENLRAAIGAVGSDEQFSVERAQRLAAAEAALDQSKALLFAKQLQAGEDKLREEAAAKKRSEIGGKINALVSELQAQIKELGGIETRCDLGELPYFTGSALVAWNTKYRYERVYQPIVFQPVEPRDPDTAIGVDIESRAEIAQRKAAQADRQAKRLQERRERLASSPGFFGQ
jgi:hypothetical protein